FNAAIADGNRCGIGCDSSTTTPAIVYFPHGTYMVNAPIVMYYYTQLVGDATNLPIIKAFSSFSSITILDADKYFPRG
ncbi:glycoside hydrolase family 55 protein, partial [Glonium stellatum]